MCGGAGLGMWVSLGKGESTTRLRIERGLQCLRVFDEVQTQL